MARGKKNYRKTKYTEEDLEQLIYAIALSKFRNDDGEHVKMTASEIKARTSALQKLLEMKRMDRMVNDGDIDFDVEFKVQF